MEVHEPSWGHYLEVISRYEEESLESMLGFGSEFGKQDQEGKEGRNEKFFGDFFSRLSSH